MPDKQEQEDQTSELPTGVTKWEDEFPKGTYISNLNNTAALLGPEENEKRLRALSNLAHARRQPPPNDIVVN